MRKYFIILLLFFSLQPNVVLSNDNIVSYVPEAKRVGGGRLSFLFWDVYDITLYAPKGSWQQDKPFAIELSYLMDIEARKIADRSIEEMRKQGIKDEIKLATWHNQISKIFPDVSEGIKLVGICTKNGESIFMRDGEIIGRISDEEFSEAFFNIWLGEKTSAPDLRSQLLGD